MEKPKLPPISNKSNTTSTMYISSTISKPDMKVVIKAIARLLKNKLEEDKDKVYPVNNIYYNFNEEKYMA